jgi:hypothetical protein
MITKCVCKIGINRLKKVIMERYKNHMEKDINLTSDVIDIAVEIAVATNIYHVIL